MRIPVGGRLTVYGYRSVDGSISSSAIQGDTSYVAGADSVTVSGVISAVDSSTGQFRINGATVDYTPLLSTDSFQVPSAGDTVEVVGVQPSTSGLILANSVGGIRESGTSVGGIRESGTSVGGIRESGTSVGGIRESGTSVGGIRESGTSVGGIRESGTSVGGIRASGTSVGGIRESGTSVGGIRASGTSVGGVRESGTSVGGIREAGTSVGGVASN
jgi:hypothetical protein